MTLSISAPAHPLYLYEQVTGSRHYHLGLFDSSSDTLAEALDRMVAESARHFAPAAEVLDVGCALGGATEQLVNAGFRATGIDPSTASIAHARSHSRASFVCDKFESFARRPTSRFEALLTTETLQHFPALETFFGACRRVLRPGGIVVVNDVVRVAKVRWGTAPFHPPGAVAVAGVRGGFELITRDRLSEFVAPTFDHLLLRIERQRASIVARFKAAHPPVATELEELLVNFAAMREGFATGDLRYERTVLRLNSS